MLKMSIPALAGLSLLLALVGCNMPAEQFPPPDDVQTAAALTLQAFLPPSLTSATDTPGVTATPSPSATRPASSATPSTATVTLTYAVPVATVREATNCRTGPGEAYEVIFTYLEGKELEIVGRYQPGDFWLVKSNESPTGTCWLWGEFVDVTGSFEAVPSVTAPPTSTSAPPRQPGIVEWNFSCGGGVLTFTVIWVDNATGESGYRIFRNGEAIAELPANATTHTDLFSVSADQSVEYYIQVHSTAGTANSSIMRMRCG